MMREIGRDAVLHVLALGRCAPLETGERSVEIRQVFEFLGEREVQLGQAGRIAGVLDHVAKLRDVIAIRPSVSAAARARCTPRTRSVAT